MDYPDLSTSAVHEAGKIIDRIAELLRIEVAGTLVFHTRTIPLRPMPIQAA